MNCILSIVTINLNNSSGLISTFNSIHLCLQSPSVEWIVVDGASTDDSVKNLTQQLENNFYEDRVRVESNPDCGIYDAMNKGVALATGKYLMFLNSGDRLFDCRLLKSWVAEVLNNGLPQRSYFFGFKYQGKLRECRPQFWLYWKMMTSHQAMLIHKSTFNFYKYDLRFRFAADYHLMCFLVKNFEYVRCSGTLIENEEYGDGVHLAETRREYCLVCSEYRNKLICWGLYLFKIFYELIRFGR